MCSFATKISDIIALCRTISYYAAVGRTISYYAALRHIVSHGVAQKFELKCTLESSYWYVSIALANGKHLIGLVAKWI